MLTKEQFQQKIAEGFSLLDGATGSNLRNAGMPKGCCAESWILEHPEPLVSLQRSYAEAGSKIIYAPTFQAQPIALKTVGLDAHTEKINEALVALSRSAAPGCLIAGDLTTLTTFCDSWDEENFDLLVENYRRQIRGLDKGHEEGGSAYANAGSSLRSPPGYSRASPPPKKPESAYCIALCSHL